MKKSFLVIPFLLVSLLGCNKEENGSSLTPKNSSGFSSLPKSIHSLCVDVADVNESRVNEALYDVFNAYILSYKTSSGIRNDFQAQVVSSNKRNVKFFDVIDNNKQVFFNYLQNNSFTGVGTCSDLSCVNPYFSYQGYDYEVALTYFNKENPNVSFGNSVIFALGQDFVHETNEYEDVIPGVLLEYKAGTYITTEIGISEIEANSTLLPVIIFNFAGIGDTLDDKCPVYGEVEEPDSTIEDKSQYFNLYVTALKANLRFENDNYSEFIIHHKHNWCCDYGWANSNYSVLEDSPHYNVHKNKIGHHITSNWHLFNYWDSMPTETWWSKMAVYEWDWWAIGKNANIRLANSTQTKTWEIQARFKHEWYLAIDVFKNDAQLTTYGQTFSFSTPNGYIYLTRK